MPRGGGGGGGGAGGSLYFTNLVLTSPHVGILRNFIICYHSACDFCVNFRSKHKVSE